MYNIRFTGEACCQSKLNDISLPSLSPCMVELTVTIYLLLITSISRVSAKCGKSTCDVGAQKGGWVFLFLFFFVIFCGMLEVVWRWCLVKETPDCIERQSRVRAEISQGGAGNFPSAKEISKVGRHAHGSEVCVAPNTERV